ncbi:MAG: DUF177 domain-containing protein [Candidatus Firestonebacteria bacterium]|nr:DUF177 domain-containing protein [Candidatus Firestonebacteria bacterium]
MILDISKQKEGISCFDIIEPAAKLGLIDTDELKYIGPVKANIEFNNLVEKFAVKGRAKAGYETVCARCGKAFKGMLNVEFDYKYLKNTSTENGQINKAGLDEERLKGNELNLGEDIRQAVLLEISEKTVCQEKCKGLCPGCGKNLNESNCSCKEGNKAPFADLKKLLREKKGKR